MGKVQNGDVKSLPFFGGVGLRPAHYDHVLSTGAGSVRWFEVISENFMNSLGRPRAILRKIRRDYPVALHGVSMSLGSGEGLNPEYLKSLKVLVDEIDPLIVSDHLCLSRSGAHYAHDLLPFPFTRQNLEIVSDNVSRAQDYLGRKILVENISAYVGYANSQFSEPEFLSELCRRSGCGLLLDINNVYVNSVNFQFSASDFLRDIPQEFIGQIHLAGFSDRGEFLFDTHSAPVHEEVWKLYRDKAPELKGVPVLIEWDDELPSFRTLEEELAKAAALYENALTRRPNEIPV